MLGRGSISPEAILVLPDNVINFEFYVVTQLGIGYFAAMYVSSSWLIRGHSFKEREDASVHPSLYRVLIMNCIAVSEQYVVALSGLPYFCGNFIKPCGFSIFNFSKYLVEFF